MTPIADFIPTPVQVLAAGVAWEQMPKEGRNCILTLTGQLGLIGPSLPWSEIPATFRLELAHRVYLLRDLLVKVLP